MCISDIVVRPIVVATRGRSGPRPRRRSPSASAAIDAAPADAEPDRQRAVDDRGAGVARGAAASGPGGASKPSPNASSTSIAKLIQRICSGVSGAPLAMSKMPAPTNVRMNAAEHDHLDPDVLHQVVVDARGRPRPR